MSEKVQTDVKRQRAPAAAVSVIAIASASAFFKRDKQRCSTTSTTSISGDHPSLNDHVKVALQPKIQVLKVILRSELNLLSLGKLSILLFSKEVCFRTIIWKNHNQISSTLQ